MKRREDKLNGAESISVVDPQPQDAKKVEVAATTSTKFENPASQLKFNKRSQSSGNPAIVHAEEVDSGRLKAAVGPESSFPRSKTADELIADHVGEIPKVENEFSLASLRAKSEDAVPVSNTRPGTVTVGKPNDDVFVRTSKNPEDWVAFNFVELKTDKKLYMLTPKVVEEIHALNEERAQVMIKMVKKRLIYTVTRLGDPLLWPVTILEGNDWIDSANNSANAAKERWVRVVSNVPAGRYDYVTSPSTEEPRWPTMTYEEAVLKAFDDKLIDSLGHDVIRQLLGED